MKYVIVKALLVGIERVYPFIFPERLTHSEVAKWVEAAVMREFDDAGAKLYSAGFCHLYGNQWQAKHGSESLNIRPDPRQEFRDQKILNMPEAFQWMLSHVDRS